MTSIDPARAVGRLVAAIVLAAACWGCGSQGDGFQRFPVAGEVLHDGQPLKSGTVTFTPDGAGAAGSAEVVDGHFTLAAADGLSPGGYRVEIYSIRATGRKVPSSEDPNTLVDEATNVVDRRFNLASTLHADIPPGGPAGPLSFDVASPSPSGARSKRR